MMRHLLLTAALIATLPAAALAQGRPLLPDQPPRLPDAPLPVDEGSAHVIYPVRDGVFMISGPDGNVAVQTGTDGVLLVDSGTAADAPGLLRQVRRLSARPLAYILNTSGDADHVGGNALLSAAGIDLVGGLLERPSGIQQGSAIPVFAHESVMTRLIENGTLEGLPTQTYFVAQKDIHFNASAVSLIHAPGHTAGDSVVMFRRADVIAAGDAYTPDRYPLIDLANGGSITAYLATLNRLISLTVPEFNQQGGTFVIPGHGRLSDEGDLGDYRDMVTFIHDRIKAARDAGQTLEQVLQARPTQDYDPLFGAEAGAEFTRQVYLSLEQEGGAQ